MEIAPLGSGRHAHQIIAVVTKGPHTEGRWALTTALHRTPEGGVCVLHPWDQPFLPAGADPHGMWPYLYEKIVGGNGGNGYSFEVEGCEVDDVAGITALIQARADEVANNTYGPFGNEVHFWNSSPAATEPEPDDTPLVAEEPQPPIEALSWRLAARLATDLGTTYELQERHDGNGTYDQLYFASESRLHVSLNRVGSVFVMTPELDRILPHAEWGSLAQAADMEAVAQRILGRVGGSGEPMKGADVIAGAMDLPRAHEQAERVGGRSAGTTASKTTL